MPPDADKIVDGFVGVDDPLSVYTVIHDGLIRLDFTEEKAKRYAYYCQVVYKELKDNHDALDSFEKISKANKLLPEAITMKLIRSTSAIKSYRWSGIAGVAGPIVDRLATIAQTQGIPLDDCSLSIVKVSLDIAGAGGGALSLVSGVGIPLLFLNVAATYNDSHALGKACFR